VLKKKYLFRGMVKRLEKKELSLPYKFSVRPGKKEGDKKTADKERGRSAY